MIGRMLGFGVDADGATHLPGLLLRQCNNFIEGRDLEEAVEGLAAVAEGLDGPQGPDLRQGEVAGEEALFLSPIDHRLSLAAGELRPILDVGGVDHIRLVPGD